MKNKSKDWLSQVHSTDDYVLKAMKSENKDLLPKMLQTLRNYTEGEKIIESEELDKEMAATEIREEKLKSYLLDTLCRVTVKRAGSGGTYKEFINLETQNRDHPFIDKRFWSYGCHIVSHHTGRLMSIFLLWLSLRWSKINYLF